MTMLSSASVQRATLDEFLRAPIGRWTHAPPMVMWMASPKLVGIMYAGFVNSTDVPRLRELAEFAFHPALVRPYRALIDCGGLVGVDSAAFAYLVEYLRKLTGITTSLVERVACVRAPGMTGAASIGLFHEHMVDELDMRFVEALDEAIDHLGAREHRAAIQEINEVGARVSIVAALRGVLRENTRQSLATVARRLGVSSRSLQRACQEAGSSYRDEVANARFAIAEEQIRASNDKVEAIARRAGYASAATLARRFQRMHGVTPTEYRKRRS